MKTQLDKGEICNLGFIAIEGSLLPINTQKRIK